MLKNMKRFALLLAALLLALLTAAAQEGLKIDQLFDGKFNDRKGTTEILVKGKRARSYGLSLFRSLTFRPTEKEALWVERLVRADRPQASNLEEGRKNARLYYSFYEFPPLADGQHRYLFYRNNQLKEGAKGMLTVIYMEGTASMAELRRRFGQ